MNIHECLRPEPETGEPERITIRLKPGTKAKLEQVCMRHGVTPAAFFRNCAEQVCQGYGDPPQATSASTREA
jgi:hypothetical protein